MTNLAIIEGAKLLNGITERVDTYQGWQRRGKQVKRGSKALFKTSIWKPVKGKNADEKEDNPEPRLIMVSAAFFGASQVEDIHK